MAFPQGVGDVIRPLAAFDPSHLNAYELDVLTEISRYLGHLSAQQLVKRSHEESAYRRTAPFAPVSLEYARDLGPLSNREGSS